LIPDPGPADRLATFCASSLCAFNAGNHPVADHIALQLSIADQPDAAAVVAAMVPGLIWMRPALWRLVGTVLIVLSVFAGGSGAYAVSRALWPFLILWWPWLLAGVIAVVALGAWWLWWRLPKRQMQSITAADPKARADIEDNFRKTIGQLLGGAAVLIGAVFAYVQFTQQQRAAHDLLISNQVAKGFELLGNKDSLQQRLGGIYALEGVMNDSEQYHQPVLEALSAFVRDNTQSVTGDSPPATDVQAALTVIGRRKVFGEGELNLVNAHMPQAQLRAANLAGANLRGADLRDADLQGADLRGADVSGTTLGHADLSTANLSCARVIPGILCTDLQGADMRNTILARANLRAANLRCTNLSDADLRFADLTNAHLNHADLSSANLHRATYSADLLQPACGTNVDLGRLTLKPCSNTFEVIEECKARWQRLIQ
jgi:uncharacterized protein YjbI with pentapeptide repeats